MLFDTHAHYEDEKFDADRDQVIQNIKDSGYIKYILNASSDVNLLNKVITLAKRFDFMYASLGVHPYHSKEITDSAILHMAELSSFNKVVAIGEIGLDYHYDDHDKESQKKWFIRQIDLAKQLHLPIIVHDRDAHQDTLNIVKQESAGSVGGVFHCYAGSVEMLKDVLNNNFYISVGGVVTFKNAKTVLEVIKSVPLDRLILETDCPYLAPDPHRGKRNDSRYLNIIAQKVADIRGLELEQIAQITTANAEHLFNIH